MPPSSDKQRFHAHVGAENDHVGNADPEAFPVLWGQLFKLVLSPAQKKAGDISDMPSF